MQCGRAAGAVLHSSRNSPTGPDRASLSRTALLKWMLTTAAAQVYLLHLVHLWNKRDSKPMLSGLHVSCRNTTVSAISPAVASALAAHVEELRNHGFIAVCEVSTNGLMKAPAETVR